MADPVPFRPGQRWISEREPELGLGTVASVTPQAVVVDFGAVSERRAYGLEGAPLKRVRFRVGDSLQLSDTCTCVVQEVREEGGLIHYLTSEGEHPESALSGILRFSAPKERLLMGLSDPPDKFELRVSALRLQHARRKSPVRGFAGARMALLKHQLSIAEEVTRRLLPRVLLADEVGLGKTIEAGLILARLIATGRARRVLVLVPESLVHQWFLELFRRFHLWFAIFDEARCRTEDGSNPFLEAQWVLASVDLVARSPERLAQAMEAGWDLVVVDEAHHLAWSPEGASPAYAAVEALGQAASGLLLLTATPEQLGLEGHFARLRLLDPDRFGDLDRFRRETEDFRKVGAMAQAILDGQKLSNADQKRLKAWLGEIPEDRDALLQALVDRHGTGRVMFRNTRSVVRGFPERVARLAPLTGDPKPLLREWTADREEGDRWRPAFREDPRLAWLLELLDQIEPGKALLICQSRRKVEALEAVIRELRPALKAAAFHEGMTLVQRDRAAAWFAEEGGARLLICSEIGSEGRNFQMAHHLVLFDLPLDPGLLEQRIGRLDRIGQQEAIQIHVPFVVGSPQEALVRWYHEGFDAFQTHVPDGRELREVFGERLLSVATLAPAKRGAALDALLEETRATHGELKARLEAGRDRLLELNSCRPGAAEALITEIQTRDGDPTLETFLLAALEELAPRTWRLGSAGVLVESFPGLPPEGAVVTRDRARALAREDVAFLTEDHPLISGALDLVLGDSTGNSGFAHWPDGNPAVYLEAIFVLEAVAPACLHVDRFLPPTPIRVMVDSQGHDQSRAIPRSTYVRRLVPDDPRRLLSLEPFREGALPRLLARAHRMAHARIAPAAKTARAAMRALLNEELERLKALRRIGAPVMEEEITALCTQRDALESVLERTQARLEAVRVIRRG